MMGQMINYETASGASAPGYLETTVTGRGTGVIVLHAWCGLK